MRIIRFVGLTTIALLAVGLLGFFSYPVFAQPSTPPAAQSGDDPAELPITGAALSKASTAALASTNGGRVTESEVGDEDGYYEVEVTLDDGSQVDVHLDENFNLIGQETDRDDPNDQDGLSDE